MESPPPNFLRGYPTITGDHGWGVGIGVGYTPLLECDAPSTGKGATMKRRIIKNNDKYKIITHLEGCTRQSCPVHTHLLQELELPHGTSLVASL